MMSDLGWFVLPPLKGCTYRSLRNMEVIMQDQFNVVSLANLSRIELLAILANLQRQFNAASSNTERAPLRTKIAKVSYALALS